MAITAATSKQALVDLINKDNSTAFTLAQLVLTAPAVIAEPVAGRNATVKITGADASALPGEVVVTYTRPSITSLLAVSNWRAPAGTEATEAGIIAAVKASLVEEMVTSIPLEDGSYAVTASLKAEGDEGYDANYPWAVSVDFSAHYVVGDVLAITVGIAPASLSDQVKTTELSGFTNADIAPDQQG